MLERKKCLAAILLAATVCVTEIAAGGITVSAEAAQGKTDAESLRREADAEGFDISWSNVNNNGMTLFRYTGDAKKVVIPDGVETIDQYAFSKRK